ncbi:hypothetical protein AB0368_32915 [Actinoplanes sp. NPDC051475]|uniref:phasin family protein n=1 Tax=Actinoplanes sp. NPDC051475 TaxID=3157225 RepID=UPI00344F1B4F
MQDAWRAYLEMALGLTEAPRKRAQKVAGELLNKGGATAGQLQGLVEDLMSTGMANRQALTNLVRYEVDRALGLVGLATAEEVSDLTTRVRDLEKELRLARANAAGGEAAGDLTLAEPGPVSVEAPAKKAVVKKAVAKKAAKPATPNAMPAAATTATPPRKAAKKVTPATTGPAKAAPGKAVPAKATKAAKAARKTATPGGEPAGSAGTPTAPAGTVAAPNASVKAAAAETVLPTPAKKAATKNVGAKKTAAKKTTPAKSTPAENAAGADTSTPEVAP